MRYMLLIYTQEDVMARGSQEEMELVRQGHAAVLQEARARGVLQSADPLKDTSTATTVRMRNGKATITDGPFAETKEQLAGYYILDCNDLDDAIAWASKIPTACGGLHGCVEIRPLRAMPSTQTALQMAGSAPIRNG